MAMTPGATADGPAPVMFVHHAGLNWIRGSTRCLLDLLTHIDRARFAPIVWTNQPVILDAVRALHVPAIEARDWISRHPLRPDRQWIRDAHRLVQQHRVRLLHTDEFTQASVLIPAARRARIPLLAQLHQVPTDDERLWSLLHQVDLAVGTTRACITGLLADGFPEARAAVIYNGVDPMRLSAGDATQLRAQLGIPCEATVLTLVGSLIHRKAVDVALHAFASVTTNRPMHLLLCGSGEERTALESLARTLGVSDRTTFLGECAHAGAILRDATDILLAPSRDESFGLTLAEAGLFGVPAIASDIPAHVEVIGSRPGPPGPGGGLLVPVEDPRGLALAIDRLAGDETLRQQHGAAAQRRVTSMFLVDRYVRDFEATYSRLIDQPASAYGWRNGVRWPRAYNAWIRDAIGRRLGRAPSHRVASAI